MNRSLITELMYLLANEFDWDIIHCESVAEKVIKLIESRKPESHPSAETPGDVQRNPGE